MGLDMYLEKCNRKAWGFKDIDVEAVKESNKELYASIKPFLHKRGTYFTWESIFEKVGYWRKANAIHKWFVDNVQDGYDDCGYYEVTKEQLEELLSTCITVRNGLQVEDGYVKNGEKLNNGVFCPIYEEGEIVTDSTIAEALLPTQDGFFFGGTDYDQWYVADINSTIEILTKTLDTTDFDIEMIVYSSSW